MVDTSKEQENEKERLIDVANFSKAEELQIKRWIEEAILKHHKEFVKGR